MDDNICQKLADEGCLLPSPDADEKRVYVVRHLVELPLHISDRVPYDKAKLYVVHNAGINICLVAKKGEKVGKCAYGYLTTTYDDEEPHDNKKNIKRADALAGDKDSLMEIIEKALEEKGISVIDQEDGRGHAINSYVITFKNGLKGQEFSDTFKEEYLRDHLGVDIVRKRKNGTYIIESTEPIDELNGYEMLQSVQEYVPTKI